MNNEITNDEKNVFINENGEPVENQYVDEFGNPIDPSLIDESGNYIGGPTTEYIDEFGNPIDPSLIDEFGNYIGPTEAFVDENGNVVNNEPQVQANAIDQAAIANALNQVESGNVETVESVQTAPISASAHQMDDKEMLQGMVTFDYNNVPITDIVNSIILDAINKGASDIHFDPFDDGIKIRIRIDGELNDYSIVPLFVKKNMITRIKIISGMNITESRTPQDGAIRTELANKTIDLRVSCLPTNMGEKIVIRIMDYSMSAAGIEALDFSEHNLEKVRKMLALPNGIILVTGATGSGKSTTVYSMLQRLNVEGTNLITVEDPIEMNIGGINQVQAVSEIGLDFATVLRSILRQDPDVIMIGEIRDDETARIAVRAAITGHLVLSTIHTNNSLNTIERLTDMSVERYLLGTALSGIVSQKLARRLCDKCKRLRPVNDYEKDVFKKALDKDIEEIYEPVGCPECSRGYRGRIAIQEVLLLNQNIQDAITKGVSKDILRKLVYGKTGTETMLQDGLAKVLDGKTSFDEIIKLIDLEDDLGEGTQLGLEDQLDASNMANNNPVNLSNNPININITPELLSSLNMASANISAPTEQEEVVEEIIIKPTNKKKKKKKKIVEVDEEDLKSMLSEDEESEETVEPIDIENEDIEEEDIEEEIDIDQPLADFNQDLEKEAINTVEVANLDEEKEIEAVEVPANIDTIADAVIEELDNAEQEKNKLHPLYEKLVNTRDSINEDDYTNKVKSILDEIKEEDAITIPVPPRLMNYIKEIETTSELDYNKKKDIIDKFNEVFNVNEELDVEFDNITNNSINFLDNLEEMKNDIKIEEPLLVEEIPVNTSSNDIEDDEDDIEPTSEYQEELESIDINRLTDHIIDTIDEELDLDVNLEDIEDADDEEMEEELTNINIDDIITQDNNNNSKIDMSIEEILNNETNELSTQEHIDKNVVLQDDYQRDNNGLVIDESLFDSVDDNLLNSLLDNLEYEEEAA